ncbi:MAG: polysaccharide biosynthesis protein [Francisellaceae bacterium]
MIKTSLLKNKKAWLVFSFDIACALASWFFVCLLIYPQSINEIFLRQELEIFLAYAVVLKCYRTYAALWKKVSVNDLYKNIYAVIIGSLLFFGMEFFIDQLMSIQRAHVIFFPLMTLFCMLAGRFFFRQFVMAKKEKVKTGRKIILLGAGDGANLFLIENEYLQTPYRVVAIFDDNPELHGKKLSGIPIVGAISQLKSNEFIRQFKIDEIVIAMPSLGARGLREVYLQCQNTGCRIKITPSILELTRGAEHTDLKEVSIEELLGREQVFIHESQLHSQYDNATVLVTGGGGSIGYEICRQLLLHANLKKLIILDHSEYNLYKAEMELEKHSASTALLCVLASVTDFRLLNDILVDENIDIIFHAAAYKHVPMLETQTVSAIYNNIIGTRVMTTLAEKYKVAKFVLVSTDKAVRPTNIMGATKRIAELYVSAKANAKSNTRFIITRFGNVLGSTGSVIPLFRSQLAKGGPLTVTDKNIERYFMTIPEAALLVTLSASVGQGGETFVLEMGQPIKIKDLAEELIRLSGKKPYVDIDIEFTGLRPGEKMYEELFYDKSKLKASGFDKLLISENESLVSLDIINSEIEDLLANISREKLMRIVADHDRTDYQAEEINGKQHVV